MNKNKEIIKFNQRNAIKKAIVKTIVRKKAQPKVRVISTEDDIKEKPLFIWKNEKKHLSKWMDHLEKAQFDFHLENHPERSSAYALAEATVTDDDDGSTVWIAIGGNIRYAIKKKTCQIFQVSGSYVINKRRCYGLLRNWSDWHWNRYWPVKKDYTYEDKKD